MYDDRQFSRGIDAREICALLQGSLDCARVRMQHVPGGCAAARNGQEKVPSVEAGCIITLPFGPDIFTCYRALIFPRRFVLNFGAIGSSALSSFLDIAVLLYHFGHSSPYPRAV
jgi:hypothetical protein